MAKIKTSDINAKVHNDWEESSCNRL